MIERFKESWAGHCRVASELDAKNLALQYSDGIEDLNQLLRKQCHGMDLESNDADIRKRAAQLSNLAGECFANYVTQMRRFLAHFLLGCRV